MNKATFAAQVRTQYPFISTSEADDIARRSLQHADSVGRNEQLPLNERVRCAVVAHIRHEYTTYEHDLQYMSRSQARRYADRDTLHMLESLKHGGKQ